MRTSGSTFRIIERALVAMALGLVIGFYYWTIAANRGFEDSADAGYYRSLVRGWQKGQLALDTEPSPELLALADPYDPAQNSAHRLGDVSYFRGKYYLYFGAAPALTLMLPYTLITGREMTTGMAVFWFCTAAFLTASGLWLAIRRRYFPHSAGIVAPLGVLALGFGTHLLALAQRPAFWELPIAAGIAFTLLAVVGVYRAIHGRQPLLAMAGAGLCLGLAVASRPTCLFATPMLIAPIWFAWRERSGNMSPRWWRLALAAGVPLGACGLAMMAHNYARFENPLEFGQHYQLSGAYEGKLVHFSPRFISHNIAVYLFQPLKWTWTFPFVSAQGIEIDIPGYFGTEEVCGLAVTFFFAWFALGVPWMFPRRPPEEKGRLAATLGGIAGYVVPVAALLLSYFSTTARYQTEFAVGFGLVAACGMLGFERGVQRLGRGAIAAVSLATLLCLSTVVMGALVSLDYHGRELGRTHPQLWTQLDRNAQAVLGRVGQWLGHFDGPRVLKVRFHSRPTGTIETFWETTDPRAKERIMIEHTGDHLIRFGYARTGPVQWGRPLKWETNHTHTVDVQLPSLYGPPRGWLRGLRRRLEFRERSGVAVWFSGGRALDVVVDPWPADITPGGAMGGDFSGEVRATRTRLFRDNELSDNFRGLLDGPRGGTLRLRVVLPNELLPAGEPLFAAGVHYGSDIVFIRPANGGFKLVFEHYGSPQVESAVLRHMQGPRTVEISLPSCKRGEDFFGKHATGDIVIRVDGSEILRSRQACTGFAPGSEEIGWNPFGTTCGPEFCGWILDARWTVAGDQP